MNKKLSINKDWFKSKNVRPKTFICHMEYSPGGFRVAKAFVENKINQHAVEYQRVDCRDLHKAISDSDLIVN
jgi:hypothetical protein